MRAVLVECWINVRNPVKNTLVGYRDDTFSLGDLLKNETAAGGIYCRLSIYRGYMWYDGVRSITITMVKHQSDLHSQTTPHIWLSRTGGQWGVFLELYK